MQDCMHYLLVSRYWVLMISCLPARSEVCSALSSSSHHFAAENFSRIQDISFADIKSVGHWALGQFLKRLHDCIAEALMSRGLIHHGMNLSNPSYELFPAQISLADFQQFFRCPQADEEEDAEVQLNPENLLNILEDGDAEEPASEGSQDSEPAANKTEATGNAAGGAEPADKQEEGNGSEEDGDESDDSESDTEPKAGPGADARCGNAAILKLGANGKKRRRRRKGAAKGRILPDKPLYYSKSVTADTLPRMTLVVCSSLLSVSLHSLALPDAAIQGILNLQDGICMKLQGPSLYTCAPCSLQMLTLRMGATFPG